MTLPWDLTDSVIVHDRYVNYDSAKLGTFIHQLCCAHYPDLRIIPMLDSKALVAAPEVTRSA